jgi:predicted CoA-binding protein
VTAAERILRATKSVLVIDWPTRDVPEALAGAGYEVAVKGGPGPEDYSSYELRDRKVVVTSAGRPPEYAELVYSHRPLDELSSIVAMARELRAKAVWYQSGVAPTGADHPKGCWLPKDKSMQARKLVEAADLAYIDAVYIADVVRRLGVRLR